MREGDCEREREEEMGFVRPLICLFAILAGNGSFVLGFGKYLQHQQEQRRNRGAEENQAMASRSKDAEMEDGDVDPVSRTTWRKKNEHVEIEVVAAVLIAGIFGVFIVIYTIFLQCWWRFRQRKRRDSRPECTCCKARETEAWEPIDLEKVFDGSSNNKAVLAAPNS